jgi:hypothetical protein
MNDEVERELLKIEAVADPSTSRQSRSSGQAKLVTVDAGELARNTAAGLGVVILEACAVIREQKQGGDDGGERIVK